MHLRPARTIRTGGASMRCALPRPTPSSNRNPSRSATRSFTNHSSPLLNSHPSSSPQSSIHPSEIAHFTRLSSTWWDPQGELGLLHKMNKGRVEFLRSKVIEVENWERSLSSSSQSEAQRLTRNEEARYEAEWIKGKKVLDVGCGGGLLSESLARLGASVTGIDATSTNISIAQHHSSQDPFFTPDRLTYQHCAAEDLLASHAASFDIVASVEVLEHVSEPASFLQSLNKLLKPGGHLLLSTISRTPLAWLLTIGMAENVLGLVSKGTHSYEKYIKSSELVEFIRKPAEQGGLGWTLEAHRVGAKERTAQARQSDAFGPLDPLPSSSLTLETRGIIYNPLVSDWKLLDRHSTLQKSGWGEECNYLLWARKPERGS